MRYVRACDDSRWMRPIGVMKPPGERMIITSLEATCQIAPGRVMRVCGDSLRRSPSDKRFVARPWVFPRVAADAACMDGPFITENRNGRTVHTLLRERARACRISAGCVG